MDMPTSTQGLLGIGEFSRLSQLSVRMLRYYDRHGLLEPAVVDSDTGYRFYSAGQLARAGQIRMLRDMGCAVARISEMLPLFRDPNALREALALQHAHLEGEAKRLAEQLREVERLTAYLKELTVSIDVRLVEVPACHYAVCRDVIPTFSDEGILWERLMAALPQTDAEVSGTDGPPIVAAAFLDPDYRESDVDIEARVSVARPFTGVADAQCVEIPAHRALSSILRGSFDAVGAVMEAIGAEVEAQGLKISGPMYNVYLVGPSTNPDPAEWVTDVRLMVE